MLKKRGRPRKARDEGAISPAQIQVVQSSPRERRLLHRETQEAYFRAMLEVATLDEWREITRVAVQQAKEGNNKARQWLTSYIVGRPKPRMDSVAVEETANAVIAVVKMSVDDL